MAILSREPSGVALLNEYEKIISDANQALADVDDRAARRAESIQYRLRELEDELADVRLVRRNVSNINIAPSA